MKRVVHSTLVASTLAATLAVSLPTRAEFVRIPPSACRAGQHRLSNGTTFPPPNIQATFTGSYQVTAIQHEYQTASLACPIPDNDEIPAHTLTHANIHFSDQDTVYRFYAYRVTKFWDGTGRSIKMLVSVDMGAASMPAQ